MSQLRQYTPGRVELRADGQALSGLAAVFYDGSEATEYVPFDGLRERILPGAFDAALKRRDDVRCLWNHNPDKILGRTKPGTLQLRTERAGLRYEVPNLGGSTVARDVREWIQRGEVDGSSFAFLVEDEEQHKEDGDWIREVASVRLVDVGPVAYPAYHATTSEMRDGHWGDLNRRREARLRKWLEASRVPR